MLYTNSVILRYIFAQFHEQCLERYYLKHPPPWPSEEKYFGIWEVICRCTLKKAYHIVLLQITKIKGRQFFWLLILQLKVGWKKCRENVIKVVEKHCLDNCNMFGLGLQTPWATLYWEMIEWKIGLWWRCLIDNKQEIKRARLWDVKEISKLRPLLLLFQ